MRKILVVDDVEMNRRLLRKILGNEYDIEEAEDGEEALFILHRSYNVFSAVILDLSMPGLDGFDVLVRRRDNVALSQIPVIVITSSNEEEAKVRAIALGANDFITKPYNESIIRHCLRNNINLRETASIVNALQRDKLTGIYNRETFFEKVAIIIKEEPPGSFVMASFDIDGFKLVNDQFGANEGDRILQYLGKRIKDMSEYLGGICGRISGDNFAVVFPNTEECGRYAEECRLHGFIPDNAPMELSFSVGRYVISDKELSTSSMYDRAYIAKKSIKGLYGVHMAYFDDEMLATLKQEKQIVTEMDKALADNQFEVWFQPQVNHLTGARIGAEALVRWRHPERGLISPGVFIPVFEQNGFIYELDKYVWDHTCSYLRKWIDEERNPLPVSVNISRYDILRDDLLDVLLGLLKKYNLPMEYLRLEITESAFEKSTERMIAVVKDMVKTGFMVEIDDFGSGYSSLNTLKDVPADILKLDMRFLSNTGDMERGGNILESICRMARWIGMAVLAEGVETIEQADFLKSIGCTYIQGYLYSKPLPADEFLEFSDGISKEEKVIKVEFVNHLNNESFWNPDSLDTFIFNSYVGSACVYEYYNRSLDLLRYNDAYLEGLREASGMDELLIPNADFVKRLDKKNRRMLEEQINNALTQKKSMGCIVQVKDLGRKCDISLYLRISLRVIAKAEERILIYMLVNNITDQMIAEQKEREAEIRSVDSAKQLHTIMNSIISGVSAVTVEEDRFHYIFTNDQFYNIIGYSRAEFHSKFQGELSMIHPEDRERVEKLLKKNADVRTSFSLEYRIIRKDKKICWIRSNVTTIEMLEEKKLVQLSVFHDITESYQAKQRLNKAKNQLQFLTDNIPGGIANYSYTEKNGFKMLYFNDGFCELMGYSREEYAQVTKKGLMNHVFDEERQMLLDQMDNLVKDGTPITCNFRIHTKDGGYRWLKYRGVLTEKRGREKIVSSVVLDITEEQEATEKSRINGEEYRVAMENSGSIICKYIVADKAVILTEESARFFRLEERNENIPYNKTRLKYIMPDSVKDYIAFYEEILKGSRSGCVLYQCSTVIGKCWIDAHYSTVFSDTGEPVSAIITLKDVTQELEKESIYKKWKQSLESRVEDSYTLFRCNLSKDTSVDVRMGTLLKYEFEEEYESFDEHTIDFAEHCVIPADRDSYIAFLKADTLLANYHRGKQMDRLEFCELLSDGSVKWRRLTVELVEYPNSTDVEIFLMYEDIDDIKRAENRSVERVQVDEMTSVMQRSALIEKVDERIINSAPNVRHALLLFDIDNFKQLNNVFGYTMGDRVLTDIAKKVSTVLGAKDLFGRLVGDKFVVFLNNIPSDVYAAHIAEKICEQARIVLSSEVQISCSIGMTICPRDGLKYDILYKKAEKALHRVKEAGKDDYTFYREEFDMDDKPAEEATVNYPLQEAVKKRMLIVDDNQIDYEMLANIFRNEYVIDRAPDGESALVRLQHYGSAISIVLLDLMMPGMDGFEVLTRMYENTEMKLVPVIIVSGDEDFETSLQAIRCGASDFVTKPVNPDLLRIRVASAVSKAENERLKAQNNYLQLQNSEIERYRTVLSRAGIAVIEQDWVKGTFIYDSEVSAHIAGSYDGRKFWRILLSDMVADTATVRKMQEFVQHMAEDRSCIERTLMVNLKTPSKLKHWFRMTIYKKVTEFNLTDKLIMSFVDVGSELPPEDDPLSPQNIRKDDE